MRPNSEKSDIERDLEGLKDPAEIVEVGAPTIAGMDRPGAKLVEAVRARSYDDGLAPASAVERKPEPRTSSPIREPLPERRWNEDRTDDLEESSEPRRS